MDTARAQAERFDESIGDRLDLTGETIVTIDPKDARDFDDAISLVRLENGHWRLGVHIADVAHFVPAGSPLDAEARDRGTSVYLPDRVLPMLPELISNGLASLQPDKVRYAKSGVHRVHSRRRSRDSRVPQLGDSQQAAVHVRRSRRIPGRPSAVEVEADHRRICHAGADARTGHDPPATPAGGRGHRVDAAGDQNRLGQERPRVGRARRRAHGQPPDHRGVHAGGQRGRRRAPARPGSELPPPRPRAAGSAQAAGADRVRPRTGDRVREPAKPLRDQTGRGSGQERAAGARRALRRAAEHAEGRLQPAGRRALCAAQQALLPLYLAHPPLPGPGRTPHARKPVRAARGRPTITTTWLCRASTARSGSSGPRPRNAS